MDVIQSLEKSKRNFFFVKDNRICCSLTGHELPLSISALVAYANGKKFSRALATHSAQMAAPAEWAKFLIDAALVEAKKARAKDDEGSSCRSQQQGRLFCQLTCRFVANTPADVARHVGGRRFQSALSAYQAAQASGAEFKPNTSLYARYRKKIDFAGGLSSSETPDAGGDVGEDSGEDTGNGDEDDEEMRAIEEDNGYLEAEDSEEDFQQQLAVLPQRKRKAADVAQPPKKKSVGKKVKKN